MFEIRANVNLIPFEFSSEMHLLGDIVLLLSTCIGLVAIFNKNEKMFGFNLPIKHKS